ncbi:MAG: TVP38/TMEM64 family protein [Christensenellales bacterium]
MENVQSIRWKEFAVAMTKLAFTFLLSIGFFVGLYYLFKNTGWIGKFSNVAELKVILSSAGFWSYAVFAVMQFLQVSVIPMPASVSTIVGVICFGPWIAFGISLLAILLGSVVAYIFGKTFGSRLIYWIVGKEKGEEFCKLLLRGKWAFFVMMLLPLFPDDILCLVAGASGMSFKFFLVTNLITRTIGIFCLCFLGFLF